MKQGLWDVKGTLLCDITGQYQYHNWYNSQDDKKDLLKVTQATSLTWLRYFSANVS